ncbi:hypothetical protein [Microtetraspora niveoalba]|uniref:hypothetical protein n=1 Tax=Microtetraspora niveoalba TaxID=46175 RepID=UPI0008335782|nr:hypothetical protein [Microtetraspora niveoalba]
MLTSFAARQPLLIRIAIAAVLAAVGRLLVLVGWLPPDWVVSDDAVQDGLDGLLALWAFWSAHRRVTPVAAPRDDLGRQLIPAPHPREL